MHDIRALLKMASQRLAMNSFIAVFHWVAVIGGAVALALIIADRAPAAAFVPWKWVGPALAALAIAVAVALWARRRPGELHVAVEVDERLDLREKLSTALLCEGRDDVFALAAIEDAVTTARDPRNRELVVRRFGLAAPRGWWISPVIILVTVMISFLNPLDLFHRDAANGQQITQAKVTADDSLKAIAKVVAEKPQLSKELGQSLEELAKTGPQPDANNPDKTIQNAIKQVTALNKKLDDLVNGEKGKTADAIEKSLAQLKSEDGPGKELSDAMAKGDFKSAQQALQKMQDQMAKGQLSEDQKKQLGDQLNNLAKQMEKLSQDQQKLENALKQAGLDPQLAKNSQALQQALQQNQNLNQQQKQQLQQMAAAQQAACQACKNMSSAMAKMGQGCKAGGQAMGQFAEGAAQLGDQLSSAEMLDQLLKEAKMCQGQCNSQCNKLGACMSNSDNFGNIKNGPDVGGRAHAAGGQGQFAPTPTKMKDEKADVKHTEGDIIARQLFDGEIIRGDSKAQLVKTVAAQAKGFDEGMTEEQLPRQYQEAHKHYFGELDKLTKAVASDDKKSDGKSADKPADKPADDKKPADSGDKPSGK